MTPPRVEPRPPGDPGWRPEPGRLLVVGAGALGGVVAATLAEAGVGVELWARRAELRDRIRSGGLHLRDARGARTVRVPVVEEPPADAYAYVLLVVPPDAIAAAANAALRCLSAGGALVPLANGLPEERLAPAVGAERLIGAVVDLGASSPEPGVAVRSTRGTVTLGRLRGPPDAAVTRLVRLLSPLGAVRATANLRGARFAKLALNAAFSSIATAGGERVGALLRSAAVRHLALQVFGEAKAVADAEGVALEETGGYRLVRAGIAPGTAPAWPALLARHLALLAGARPHRRSRSSMLAQLERGLRPPVAYLNGELLTRAAAHGISAPANAALLEGILAIARGEARSSRSTLARIAAAAYRGGGPGDLGQDLQATR